MRENFFGKTKKKISKLTRKSKISNNNPIRGQAVPISRQPAHKSSRDELEKQSTVFPDNPQFSLRKSCVELSLRAAA